MASRKKATPSGAGALFNAAASLNLPRVKQLLAEGADVNALDERKMSALIAACARAMPDIDVVRTLLEAGADPNAGEITTALEQVVANGHPDIVDLLLKAGADPNNDRNAETVDLLRSVTAASDSAERPWRSEQSAEPGTVRLVKAAAGNDLEYVQRLLDEGVAVDGSDQYGTTPLHEAAERGHVAIIDELLARGATVDARDKKGDTPLLDAARGGLVEVVRRLLTAGADARAANVDGFNALHATAGASLSVEMVDVLIVAGTPIDAREHVFTCTPLFFIAEHGARAANGAGAAAVERLLKAGADMNAPHGPDGWTPFLRAAAHGDLAMVKVFLQFGANPLATDKNEATAAQIARRWGDQTVADFLDSFSA